MSTARLRKDIDDGDEKDGGLHHRVVAGIDDLQGQSTHAGPGKDAFGDDGAAKERA